MHVKLALLGLVLTLGSAHALTLDEYIQQVTGENDGARASDLSAQGSLLRQGEGSLPFATSAFFNADYSDDQRLTGAPAFQGTGTRTQRIESIQGHLKAVDLALASAKAGDLVMIQADTADETVQHLKDKHGAK